MRSTCTLLLLLFSFTVSAQERITISGFVREKGSQEQLPGVNVYIPDTPYGVVTNTYGFYSITLPASDSALVVYSFVGYETSQRKILLNKNTELDVFLTTINQLDEVTVT